MAKNLGGINQPVNESQGGTNATTFNQARTNMGLNPLLAAKTLTYNVVSADRGLLIHYTGAGVVDLTLDPAATLGDGFNFILRNDAAGNITINPNGAELIDGAATLAVEPGQAVNVICTGSAFYTTGQAAIVDGANQALSNLTPTAVNESLIPGNDDAIDLGSLTLRWRNAFSETVQAGSTVGNTLRLGAYDTLGTAFFPFITFTSGNPPAGALASSITATTQAPGTNNTTLATTAYADAAIAAQYPITLAHGGTNANLTADNGGIFYSTAAAGAILASTATARQMLQSGSSAAPAWSTTVWPATTTINRILYSSSANVIGEITSANSSVLVTDGSGVPSLGTALPNGVTATTQTINDNSTKVATTAYVNTTVSLGQTNVACNSNTTFTQNVATNQYFKLTFTSNCTLAFTFDSGLVESMCLQLINAGAFTVTWTSVLWAAGAAPTFTSSGTDMVVIWHNGDNIIYGALIGKAFA